MAGLPELLTIEEAARVIRVGRTRAYAMAREWRETGGKSGLPVVDFGHALRVPLCQLETIVGGPLTTDDADAPATTAGLESTPAAGDPLGDAPDPTRPDRPAPEVSAITNPDPASTRRPSRRRTPGPDQPTLPFAS